MDNNSALVLICVIICGLFVVVIDGMAKYDKVASEKQIAFVKVMMNNQTDIICTQLCNHCGVYCHSNKLYCKYDIWSYEVCVLIEDMNKSNIEVV